MPSADGLFGTLITIYGFFMGFVIDNLGVRLSLLAGGVLMLFARVVMAATTDVTVMRVMLFVFLPAGEALGIPVLTLGIKRYTTEANRATAYGVYYSAMNVGSLMSGILTDGIRVLIPMESCDPLIPAEEMDSFTLGNGADVSVCNKALAEYISQNPLDGPAVPSVAEVLGRQAACESLSQCGYTAAGLELFGTTMSMNRCLLLSGAVAQIMMLPCAFMVREIDVKSGPTPSAGGLVVAKGDSSSDPEDDPAAAGDSGGGAVVVEKYEPRRASPWAIAKEVARTKRFWRFFLLTVILINIKMIFRHLDATLPKWLLRTYGPTTPFGLLYSINPAIIIVAVPFVMALTQGFDPLKQIKLGTVVAALSPFWITLFPTYFGAVMFAIQLSIGESIYSPKTYEYAMMISPKGREGTYSALASAPLFTAKFFVGGLSGVLLGSYCTGDPAWPDPGSCESGGTVWMIIGLLCSTSPIGLCLFERWIRQPYVDDETGEEELLTGGGKSKGKAGGARRGYAQVSRESSALQGPDSSDGESPEPGGAAGSSGGGRSSKGGGRGGGGERSSLMGGDKPPPLE